MAGQRRCNEGCVCFSTGKKRLNPKQVAVGACRSLGGCRGTNRNSFPQTSRRVRGWFLFLASWQFIASAEVGRETCSWTPCLLRFFGDAAALEKPSAERTNVRARKETRKSRRHGPTSCYHCDPLPSTRLWLPLVRSRCVLRIYTRPKAAVPPCRAVPYPTDVSSSNETE